MRHFFIQEIQPSENMEMRICPMDLFVFTGLEQIEMLRRVPKRQKRVALVVVVVMVVVMGNQRISWRGVMNHDWDIKS